MEAVNDALKLLARAIDLLSKTDFTDTRNDLTGMVGLTIDLLQQSVDKLATCST